MAGALAREKTRMTSIFRLSFLRSLANRARRRLSSPPGPFARLLDPIRTTTHGADGAVIRRARHRSACCAGALRHPSVAFVFLFTRQ